MASKHNLRARGNIIRPCDAHHALLPEGFHHLRIVNDRAQRDRRCGCRRRIYRPAHAETKTRVLCNDHFSDRNQLPTLIFLPANKSKFR